ncbi:hypothetical protein ACLMAB_11595 [Brevibacillus laterosporus]
MSVLPQVGQVMRLSLASLSEEQSKKVYKTRVADYSEKTLQLNYPSTKKRAERSLFQLERPVQYGMLDKMVHDLILKQKLLVRNKKTFLCF